MNKLFRYFLFVLVPAFSLLVTGCEQVGEATPEPQITQIYPAASTPGSLIAMYGLNVKGATAVHFGTTEATIVSDTANMVLVNVPESLEKGSVLITVETPGGAYAYPFEVLDPAVAAAFTSVSPARGNVGTEVTIDGKNFKGATSLMIGGTEIQQFSVNEAGTKITFVVPRSAYFTPFSGTFSVVTPAGTFYSPINLRFAADAAADVLVALKADTAMLLSGFGGTVQLTADLSGGAADLATIEKVVFYQGENVIGEDDSKPYTVQFTVGDDVESYTNFPITAVAYNTAGEMVIDSDVLKIRVGERIPISGGTLTGDGNERWNTDGPKAPPFPADGKYPGFLNFNGAGNLEAASGVNLPVTVPEAGRYIAALGMASGWADAESFMFLYFGDKVSSAQRTPAVPPTGWVDFNTYFIKNPFQLEEGQNMAKIRFGGPFVHPYYLDLYKF